ncbi:SDR family oxidoreductase [Neisseriaceae bacterium CLB008]
MSGLLANQKVLITGAARGLGFAFAEAAARAGAKVVLADILYPEAQAAAEKLTGAGLAAHAVALDLADPEAISRCMDEAIVWLGGLDGLVNCGALATGVGGVDMMAYDVALWDKVMSVNVRGTWLMSQAAVPHLRASGSGKIVNIASDTALWGAPKLMAYVASKGAIISMTRSMARELGPDNICVNTICPGLVLVEATEYVPQERHDLYVNGRAINRQQMPEDVTGSVLYLLSSLSSFVTGQTLPVNGGFVFN